jgi:DNA-binding LacI/PurR family transcriptional regulator
VTICWAAGARRSIWQGWGASISCSWAAAIPRRCSGESGIEADPKLVVPVDFEFESAEAAVTRLLQRHVSFDGIVASSDLIALGAIRALRRAGKTVPEDVSVVGYDDMLLARLSTPTLTTIRQNTQEAGRKLVGRVLDSSPDLMSELLPTDLIVRESCGA